MQRFVAIVVLAACGMPAAPRAPAASSTASLRIPRGAAVALDGRLGSEWSDAGSVVLGVERGWESTIRFKHDGTRLLFAFDRLGRDGAFRYPEVLLDATGDGGLVWGNDDWWFHASYRDCWSRGTYNDYDSCIADAPAWAANNYVDEKAAPEVIEIGIPFATLELAAGKPIGVAFDLTDTMQVWSMWPPRAQLAVPASWGKAQLE